VNQRAAVIARVAQALDLLAEAERLAAAAHVGFPRLVIDNHYTLRGLHKAAISGDYAAARAEVEAVIQRTVDAAGWQYLMAESGLRTFMDARAREKWGEQISSGDIPALTVENVRATFGMLYDARADMFERGVIECARGLSWDYKTNQPYKFGKRIIITYLHTGYSPNHRAADVLDDLARVFHVLDGKPEPDHRHGTYSRMWDAQRAGAVALEFEYFSLRWYKKGTGHVTFTRLDLVDWLNQIIAKHYPGALPPPRP